MEGCCDVDAKDGGKLGLELFSGGIVSNDNSELLGGSGVPERDRVVHLELHVLQPSSSAKTPIAARERSQVCLGTQLKYFDKEIPRYPIHLEIRSTTYAVPCAGRRNECHRADHGDGLHGGQVVLIVSSHGGRVVLIVSSRACAGLVMSTSAGESI